VARNRKRARDRRPRQPGTPVDPSQGLPTATHRFDNGSPELEDQNGARELEDENGAPELEPVDVGDDSFEAEPIRTATGAHLRRWSTLPLTSSWLRSNSSSPVPRSRSPATRRTRRSSSARSTSRSPRAGAGAGVAEVEAGPAAPAAS